MNSEFGIGEKMFILVYNDTTGTIPDEDIAEFKRMVDEIMSEVGQSDEKGEDK